MRIFFFVSYSTMKYLLILFTLHFSCAQQFVTNPIGNIYLSEKHWTITYNLSLNEYFKNTETLSECITALNEICHNSSNKLCNYFIDTAQSFNDDISADLSKWNALSRSVRSPTHVLSRPKRLSTIIDLGFTIISSLFGLTDSDSLYEIKEHLHENTVLLHELATNTNASLFEIKFLDDYVNSTVEQINSALRNISVQSNVDRSLFNAIQIVILSSFRHQNLQKKLNHIFSNSTSERLLEILDFVELTKTIESINLQLFVENKRLAPLVIVGSNKLLQITHEFTAGSILLHIQIPIVNVNKQNLMEFIPLPNIYGATVTILNLETRFLILFESNYYDVDESAYDHYCIEQNSIIVCNSMLEHFIYKAPPCITHLLSSHPHDNCTHTDCVYKEIELRDYYIRISPNRIFAMVINPITIRKQCGFTEQIINVNYTQQIPTNASCTLYKYINPSSIERPQSHLSSARNFTEFNSKDIFFHEILRPIPLIEKRSIHLLQAINSTEHILHVLPEQIESIKNITITPTIFEKVSNFFTSDLKGWFDNILIRIGCTIIGILVAIYFFKSTVFWLMKKIFSCNKL